MALPSFLIVGAAKSGTTTLASLLGEHPDIWMSPDKEPKFFSFEGRAPDYAGPGDAEANRNVVTTREAYEALFEPGKGAKARGEASTIYLFDPGAPEAIRRHVPGVRIVAILRQPADRAYSSFLHLRRDGREPIADFREALRREPDRRGWALLWQYTGAGRYGAQIARYLERFPRESIRVFLHEDLATDPRGTIRGLHAFLGLEPRDPPEETRRENASYEPRFRALEPPRTRPGPVRMAIHRAVPEAVRGPVRDALRRWNRTRPGLDPALRAELTALFREDILRLQDLIGRDLSPWLS